MVKELWGAYKPLVDFNVRQQRLDLVELYNIEKENFKASIKDEIKEDYIVRLSSITAKIDKKDIYKYFALCKVQLDIPKTILSILDNLIYVKFCGLDIDDQLEDVSGKLKDDLRFIIDDLGEVGVING